MRGDELSQLTDTFERNHQQRRVGVYHQCGSHSLLLPVRGPCFHWWVQVCELGQVPRMKALMLRWL